MKSLMTLTEMAHELERQQNAKRDFIANSGLLQLTDPTHLTLPVGGMVQTFGVTDHAHGQIASDLKIPKTFYDRLREEQPDMLAWNVNELWKREPRKRMARTLDGNLRALMSDKYRPLDNYDCAQAVLPELGNFPDIQIASTAITETRFYLKAVFPRIQAEVAKGDVVQAGIVVSNSEVGAGALSVMPLIYRLVCLNGMIAEDYGQRKSHVGKRVQSVEESYEFFSDETRRADDKAFWLKVRDTVRGVLTRDVFDRIVVGLREAKGAKIENSVEGAVEVVRTSFGYSEEVGNGILEHLIRGGDFTMYGLANAITRQSQDVEDYDFATQLERDGGKVIELPRSQWREIVNAERPKVRKAA